MSRKFKKLWFWCYETSTFRFTLFEYDSDKYSKNDWFEELWDSWEYYNIWNYKYHNVNEDLMNQWCFKAAKEWVKSSNLVEFLNEEYDKYFEQKKDSEELNLDFDSEFDEEIDNNDSEDKDIEENILSYEIYEAFNNFMNRKKQRFMQSKNIEDDIDEYLVLITYSKLEIIEWYQSYNEIKDYLKMKYKMNH